MLKDVTKEIIKRTTRGVIRWGTKRLGAPGWVGNAVLLPGDLQDAYTSALKTFKEVYKPHVENVAWLEAGARLDAIASSFSYYQKLKNEKPFMTPDPYTFKADAQGNNLVYYAQKAYDQVKKTSYEQKEPLLASIDMIVKQFEALEQRPEEKEQNPVQKVLKDLKERVSTDYDCPVIISSEQMNTILEQMAPLQKEIKDILGCYETIRGEKGLDGGQVVSTVGVVERTTKGVYKTVKSIIKQ